MVLCVLSDTFLLFDILQHLLHQFSLALFAAVDKTSSFFKGYVLDSIPFKKYIRCSKLRFALLFPFKTLQKDSRIIQESNSPEDVCGSADFVF